MSRRKLPDLNGRVLRYIRHGWIPVPFICVEVEPRCGYAAIIWPPEQRGLEIHIAKGDHNGRHTMEPEDWDDELCVEMAKWTLSGGQRLA